MYRPGRESICTPDVRDGKAEIAENDEVRMSHRRASQRPAGG